MKITFLSKKGKCQQDIQKTIKSFKPKIMQNFPMTAIIVE